MVWNNRVQIKSRSAFDRLSIFSMTSTSVKIRGQPGNTRRKWFIVLNKEGQGGQIPVTHQPSHRSPRGFRCAAYPHRVSGDGKMARDTEERLACPNDKQALKRAENQAGCIEWDDPPVWILALVWQLSFVLHFFGQQRQQVYGNVVLTVLLF